MRAAHLIGHILKLKNCQKREDSEKNCNGRLYLEFMIQFLQDMSCDSYLELKNKGKQGEG